MGDTAQAFFPQRATYQDILEAPPDKIAELIAGQLSLMPRPRPRHARASSKLSGLLDGPFDSGSNGPGGWVFIIEPEIHFGDPNDPDVLVPDVAGWRKERLRDFPDTAYFDIAPDWVCEVLSPTTSNYDRIHKLPVYLRENVAHVCLIDPELRSLEAFEIQGAHYALVATYENDAKVSVPPFDAATLDLANLWSL